MEGGIDSVSSVIGGIGAILCALLGTISNGLTMWVILKRSKIRGHLTSPLLFLMCLSNFVFSLIGLPIKVEWATGSPLHWKYEDSARNFGSPSGPKLKIGPTGFIGNTPNNFSKDIVFPVFFYNNQRIWNISGFTLHGDHPANSTCNCLSRHQHWLQEIGPCQILFALTFLYSTFQTSLYRC